MALFGLAKRIRIITRKGGLLNELVLDWGELQNAQGTYKPQAARVNEKTEKNDGTDIVLTQLKRTSPFNSDGLADSLSRIFIIDDSFSVLIVTPKQTTIEVVSTRRYEKIAREFNWQLPSEPLVPKGSPYENTIKGELITSEKPISPASGLRGITLYSRGKLVNAPEFFSESTSSHFYQYLTGWISVDFIDDLPEDVISTNRQSLDWAHPEMLALRKFLAGIIAQVGIYWRKERRKKREKELMATTGIDTEKWIGTMKGDAKKSTQAILDSLRSEDALDKYSPVIKALHALVPEYPDLHWRHLHEKLRARVQTYYENDQYGDAASQAVQIYLELLREISMRKDDGAELANAVFGQFAYEATKQMPVIKLNPLSNDSEKNIQRGQADLSRGIVYGFRNPIAHGPIDKKVPDIFSYVDCLNILSLASYLIARLDNATGPGKQPASSK